MTSFPKETIFDPIAIAQLLICYLILILVLDFPILNFGVFTPTTDISFKNPRFLALILLHFHSIGSAATLTKPQDHLSCYHSSFVTMHLSPI